MTRFHCLTVFLILLYLCCSKSVCTQNPYLFDETGKLPIASEIRENNIRSITGEGRDFMNPDYRTGTTEILFDSAGNPLYQRFSLAGKVLSESRVLFRSDTLDIYIHVQGGFDTTFCIIFYSDKHCYESFDLSGNNLIKQYAVKSPDPSGNSTTEVLTDQSGKKLFTINTRYNESGKPVEELQWFEDSTISNARVFEYDKLGRIFRSTIKNYDEGTNIDYLINYDTSGLPHTEIIQLNTRQHRKIEYKYNISDLTGNELSQVKLMPVYLNRKLLKQLPWYVKQEPELINISILHMVLSADLINQLLWDVNEYILSISFTVDKAGVVKDVELLNELDWALKSEIEKEIQQKLVCKPAISGTGQPIELRMSTEILIGKEF